MGIPRLVMTARGGRQEGHAEGGRCVSRSGLEHSQEQWHPARLEGDSRHTPPGPDVVTSRWYRGLTLGGKMRRREFMTLIGGAAASWPRAAGAQQPAIPMVGYIGPGSPNPSTHFVMAFRHGLSEAGYLDGQNVLVEYRWAEGQDERFPALVAELVRRRVAVIVTPGSTAGARVAEAVTTTTPIVFSVSTDPVKSGLVSSLNRPGGNATGVSYLATELGAKRLGLLRELMPQAGLFAVLIHPNDSVSDSQVNDVQAAARALGQRIDVLNATGEGEIDAAFATLVRNRADALMVMNNPLFLSRRVQLATLAARHAVPTIFSSREHVEAGGLMSYGTNLADVYRQLGVYTGRILGGAKPSDLPVVQPTKFELVINLQTAKALGLTIPPLLLAIADEVIE
jgi:putative ABC transport system substrate-binding protein